MEPFLFKHCPNCTSKNVTFGSMNKFHCSDCDFVYFHNIASAVMVWVECEGKFMFNVRNLAPAKGKMDLPGGFVDPKETAQEAASRELKEELGWDIVPQDFQLLDSFPNIYPYRGITYHTLDILLYVSFDKKPTVKLEKSEIQAVRWLSPAEIQTEEIAFDSVLRVIEKYG